MLGFDEIKKPLTEGDAIEEAKRCLQCPVPSCEKGCPGKVPCKEFIRLITEKKYNQALEKIMEKNSLPNITSRVCSVEVQCEGHCVLARTGNPIKIGLLEMFVAEHGKEKKKEIKEKKKEVAVIGSGPSGLTIARDLREQGFNVTVFEAEERAGGIPLWGIPHYKLLEETVAKEIEKLKEIGVEFKTGKKIGERISLPAIQRDFEKVFVCTGETKEKKLGLKGEKTKGVLYWTDFLKKFNGNKEKFEGKAIIIGGGNTAMDCARIAARIGYETTVVYRKTKDFMPCYKKERNEAEKEGIQFKFLLSPVEFQGENKLEKVAFQQIRIEKEQFISTQEMVKIEADMAVLAIGQQQDNTVLNGTELQGKWIESKDYSTGINKVYTAGDIVNKDKTVIQAIKSAKEAIKKSEEVI